MSGHASATFERRDRVRLRFPYSAGLVEALKDEIPAAYRDYDPEARIWTVFRSAWAVKAAVEILLDFYPEATIVREPAPERPWAEPAPPAVYDPDYAALHLLPTAPAELVRGAYRLLSQMHHPDRGGDHDRQVALNRAFASLERRGVT
jgi:hypothetical protein